MIVALAIMAGVVIPQVSGAVEDAKHGTMLANLHEVTNAIERYRMDHAGLTPDQVTDRRLAGTQSLDDVRDSIREHLTQLQRQQLQAKHVEALRSKANVEIFDPTLAHR